MAEITEQGITPTTLTGYITRIVAAFRDALGADTSEESATPQGQISGALALAFGIAEEFSIWVINGLNLHAAVGRQLSDYGTLFSLLRIDGERSTVTATLTGSPATIIPRGTRARTGAGAIFATDAQVVIAAAGSIDVLLRSVVTGPVVAGAGELTQIVDAIAGWTGISNTNSADLGRNRETDAEYRRRYLTEVASHARDGLESIRARVLQAPNVVGCLVRDNSTAAAVTVQSVSIPAGAVVVIAQGGADADIAAAIAATKPIGAPTSGNRFFDVPHVQGFDIPINFLKVDSIPISVDVAVTALADFPSTGFATMRQNLLQWFAGDWPVPGPGIFDQSGVGIGESIDLNRLRTPLNAVPGHRIDSLTVERVAGLVASIEVTNGGSGYTSPPDVEITGGSGMGAEAVAVLNSAGEVVRVDITDRGADYTSAPAIAFTGGGGMNAAATATISAAALGDPDLDQRYTLASDDITFALTP